MNIIAHNPYRMLGVFANDPIKVRTANAAKIRAYLKVGKGVGFSVDIVNVFGSITRTSEEIESALSQLSSKIEESIHSLFWLHRNAGTKEETIENLLNGQVQKFINEQITLLEYTGLINAAVFSLAIEDYNSAAKYYSVFFESGTLLDSFRDEHGLSDSLISNKELIKKCLICLCDEFAHIDWWPLFHSVSRKRRVLGYIKTVFEEIAIGRIGKVLDESIPNGEQQDEDLLLSIKSLYKRVLPYTRTLKPLDENGEKSPEAQIVLDKLCEKLISGCKEYYKTAKFENEQSVLPAMQMVRHALTLASNSETLNNANQFLKELEADAQLLPPKEVALEAKAIKKEIQSYCLKQDKIRWSLLLTRNCVAPLLSIKKKLGKSNKYYLSVSTKIADNALYNSNAEIQATETVSANKETYIEYVNVLKQAWKLHLNLQQFDLEPQFIKDKMKTNETEIKDRLEREKVVYDDIEADISLDTEDDAYFKCSDYESLVEFCRLHPNSEHFREAMERVWKYEDDAYPKTTDSAGEFLRYKENYPNSHNDSKVLEALNELLLASSGTIYEYRMFLRLYPNHAKKEDILARIDFLAFDKCQTIAQYKQYLSDFPSGKYGSQAKRKIDDIAYGLCKTTKDFNQYLLDFPNGVHKQEALSHIEDATYNQACESNDYDKYLSKYPYGKYSLMLRAKKEYECYNGCNTPSDFKSYLEKYPTGQYAELAQKAIRRKKNKVRLAWGVCATIIVAGLFIYFGSYNSNPYADDIPGASYRPNNKQTQEQTVHSSKSEQTTVQPSYSSSKPTRTDVQSSYSNKPKGPKPSVQKQPSERELYGNNRLSTGSKPYSSYYGYSKTGENYLKFRTSGSNDYVVIVKRSYDGRYMNHMYIRGGDEATLYLPDGKFYVYFYSGRGWNPNKVKGNLTGGFVSNESSQKDGPVDLVSAWCEYTLYPVQNGNLTLQSASSSEIFN